MKKLLALALALSMALSLAACGAKRESAQGVVEKAMTAVQTYDKDGMVTYLGSDEFGTDGSEDEAAENVAVAKMLLSGMTYKIVSAEEDEKAGTATVTVEITNTDMSAVMLTFMGKAFEDALQYAFVPEDQQPSDEEMNAKYMEILTSLLQSGDYGTVTNTVPVALTLSDDAWVITPSDTLIDAVMGGISSFSDAMNEAFSEMSTD